MNKPRDKYAKTNMGFYIKRNPSSIERNITIFGEYKKRKLTFMQMYKEFLDNNDLTEDELDPNTLKAWMDYLGWRTYDR